MDEDIPVALRRLIFERAAGRCEYCLLPQAVVVYRHEPDHIIPRQHGVAEQKPTILLWRVPAVTGTRDLTLARLTLKPVTWFLFTTHAHRSGKIISSLMVPSSAP